MKAALLSLALLGGQPFMQVSDRVPQFDVEALCKQTVDVDRQWVSPKLKAFLTACEMK